MNKYSVSSLIALWLVTIVSVESFRIPLEKLVEDLDIDDEELQEVASTYNLNIDETIEMSDETLAFLMKNMSVLLDNGMSQADVAQILLGHLAETSSQLDSNVDDQENEEELSDIIDPEDVSSPISGKVDLLKELASQYGIVMTSDTNIDDYLLLHQLLGKYSPDEEQLSVADLLSMHLASDANTKFNDGNDLTDALNENLDNDGDLVSQLASLLVKTELTTDEYLLLHTLLKASTLLEKKVSPADVVYLRLALQQTNENSSPLDGMISEDINKILLSVLADGDEPSVRSLGWNTRMWNVNDFNALSDIIRRLFVLRMRINGRLL